MISLCPYLFTTTLQHCKAMGKAPSAHSTVHTRSRLAQKSNSRVTATELIQDNLQAANTQVAYKSAEAIARKWLLGMIERSNSVDSMELPACLVTLLKHNLAPISFDKPTEVTVPILAEYITYRVTEAKISASTVTTIRAAFKRKFLSQWAPLPSHSPFHPPPFTLPNSGFIWLTILSQGDEGWLGAPSRPFRVQRQPLWCTGPHWPHQCCQTQTKIRRPCPEPCTCNPSPWYQSHAGYHSPGGSSNPLWEGSHYQKLPWYQPTWCCT